MKAERTLFLCLAQTQSGPVAYLATPFPTAWGKDAGTSGARILSILISECGPHDMLYVTWCVDDNA